MAEEFSLVKCLTVSGVGKNHHIRVTVGGQTSELFDGKLSYSPPSISAYSDVGSRNALTVGNQNIDISGRNFGSTEENAIDQIIYSNGLEFHEIFTAENCVVTVDHILISCNTGSGAGQDLTWSITIGGQVSKDASTSYKNPTISMVKVGHLHQQLLGEGLSTYGEEELIFLGENFGPSLLTSSQDVLGNRTNLLDFIKYGRSGNEYSAKKCTVLNHSAVRCKTIAGVGFGLSFIAKVQGLISEMSVVQMSYAKPKVVSISRLNGTTMGGDIVRVVGWNFGFTDPRAFLHVSFDDQILLPINSVAGDPALAQPDVFEFVVPEGMGTNKKLYFDVGSGVADSQHSQTYLFSYLPPEVLAISTFEGRKEGEVKLILDGVNFGSVGRIRGTSLLAIDQTCGPQRQKKCWSQKQIILYFQASSGSLNVVTGLAGDVQESKTVEFTDFNPQIDVNKTKDAMGASELETGFPTIGGDTLKLFGKFWGTVEIKVDINGRPCLNVENGEESMVPICVNPQVKALLPDQCVC